MRTIKVLAASLLGVQLVTAGAPGMDQANKDFDLGTSIAMCIVRGCQIFRGAIQPDPSRQEETITVRIDEWLFGKPGAPPQSAAIPYKDPTRPYSGMDASGLAAAWSGVGLAEDTPVTVVQEFRNGPHGRTPQPVKVTSDDHEAALVRSLAEQANRVEGDRMVLRGLVDSLAGAPNPALAGYLLTTIWLHGPNPPQPVLGTDMLLQILRSESVPDNTMGFAAEVVVSPYNGLPPAEKLHVVYAFIDLCTRREAKYAQAGYAGLEKIAAFDRDTIAAISPQTLKSLGSAYEGMVKNGKLNRKPSLESALGITPQVK